ncbi:SpoIIE family protein phosphatase [Mesobacillus foraminis]|uniref:Sigma-B regulation protein RsbU (Phosphoserine phosphatase) n=1 Tax=Mesobacillus foraminis TaxID=279826 RepID=A0A4R2BAK3_9BACI|nr:SpoIIE family protein phosphatase [Mesobacillus foraminis]TCN23961.1 sigma-B regulation protein RsbU (phosphoserine phosphatase) [Mesobacillus foraminis]
MDEQLNHAPCGFLTLSKDGAVESINETLLRMLHYERDELAGKQISSILTVPSKLFYQLYFVPLIKVQEKIEEMYLSFEDSNGDEVPVILNARKTKQAQIDCIVFPIRKRNQYENELLAAKKEAEAALLAKHEANKQLESALKELKVKQLELMEVNQQNQRFKIETKKELELARKIQETSLTDPIDLTDIQVESYYRASSELSGDIYGFYPIDQHRYGIILLDVMGHGISSALITMSLHSLFQRLISSGVQPEIVMQELDKHLHSLFQNKEETRHYCTAIYLLIDSRQQKIDYINAGHPPAIWQDKNGQQSELKATGVPIGMFEDIVYKAKTITYTRGDRLLLFTDGVTDPLGSNVLQALLRENQSLPLAKLKHKIIQSLEHQEKFYHKSDDKCFILVDLK